MSLGQSGAASLSRLRSSVSNPLGVSHRVSLDHSGTMEGAVSQPWAPWESGVSHVVPLDQSGTLGQAPVSLPKGEEGAASGDGQGFTWRGRAACHPLFTLLDVSQVVYWTERPTKRGSSASRSGLLPAEVYLPLCNLRPKCPHTWDSCHGLTSP